MFDAYIIKMFGSSKSFSKWRNYLVKFFQMEGDFKNPTYFHFLEQIFSRIYAFKKVECILQKSIKTSTTSKISVSTQVKF